MPEVPVLSEAVERAFQEVHRSLDHVLHVMQQDPFGLRGPILLGAIGRQLIVQAGYQHRMNEIHNQAVDVALTGQRDQALAEATALSLATKVFLSRIVAAAEDQQDWLVMQPAEILAGGAQ